MTYEESVSYLLDIPRFSRKTSLENLKELLKILGDPGEGKGSTYCGNKWQRLSLFFFKYHADKITEISGTFYIAPSGTYE